ncbi:TolC family protein [Tautonia rosea]|uniref:TolC family protein n=1 Tax=Tautonia rosea TaxID=2728037 RepID=UPI001475DA3E|nr:TolC family protein [Tautonia rosea]
MITIVPAAIAQDYPGFQGPEGSPGTQLPFSLQPDLTPGPPQAMGISPFGQPLPPTMLSNPMSGPPQAMGETLFRPGQQGTFVPFMPGVAPGGAFLPGLFPGMQAPAPPALGSQDQNLLLLPGLFGRSDEAPADVPSDEPFDLPEVEQLQVGTGEIPRGAPRIDNQPPGPPLMLQEVRVSSERLYPPFLAVLEGRNRADGAVQSSMGAFDLAINADSRNYPLGFYDRAVHSLFLTQPIMNTGGKAFTGYRLAYGDYPTYYNYLNTLGGGAFVSGFEQPLLQNLRLDPRRARLFQSEIERRRVEPTILRERISLLRDAAKAYWTWVSAGQVYAINQNLLKISQTQMATLMEQARPEIGRVSQIDVIAFQNVLIRRQQQLVDARRNFEQASIVLSFYLRDERGLPSIPAAENIPLAFPDAQPPDASQVEQDVAVALNLRPEVFDLMLQYDKARIDRDLARNLMLPSLNFYVFTEQNVGDQQVALKGDFRPFILEASMFFEVPLQRRMARGRIRSAEAEMRQISARTQFARDTIQNDVLREAANLRAAYESLQYLRNVEIVTRQLAEAERTRLEIMAASPLLFFVILQQQVLDAQVNRVLAEGRYFSALADYRAAVGLDAVTPEVAMVAPPTILPEVDSAPAPPSIPDAALGTDPIPPPPDILRDDQMNVPNDGDPVDPNAPGVLNPPAGSNLPDAPNLPADPIPGAPGQPPQIPNALRDPDPIP